MNSQVAPRPIFRPAPAIDPKAREFNAKLRSKLRGAGLRPTRQRMALGVLLFASGDRHVTAEKLHAEAKQARPPISLATIYNALNQFTAVGLLREIALQGSRTWYDTNTGPHYHFLVENEDDLVDIPPEAIGVLGLPSPPDGMEIIGADLIVRVRKIDQAR
ncbi:Fur family transcriptional regulator Irr [Methylocella tundrae]|uniref:Ferric uptake regulation protein n=1 Tax=Methylocella tundrae TaxID=227605 RepID=A0A4U8Z1Q8_METTU|nr:Fur family transcriptional regulator [Methylocella tundrae]WPP03199.1 Fur family transcriptional regulator [Methylocella tundrae]VFU09194.1 Ferric uptake regulation protein [Methylocella tundrae]